MLGGVCAAISHKFPPSLGGSVCAAGFGSSLVGLSGGSWSPLFTALPLEISVDVGQQCLQASVTHSNRVLVLGGSMYTASSRFLDMEVGWSWVALCVTQVPVLLFPIGSCCRSVCAWGSGVCAAVSRSPFSVCRLELAGNLCAVVPRSSRLSVGWSWW